MSKRKGFNFYASYYEVYKELSNKDKVAFMDALLKKQFCGVDPGDLEGMAKFAYVSQKHSIEAQVKGWEDKTGQQLQDPTEPPCLPPTEPPSVQVQEKEQVQEKGKEKYNSEIEKIDFAFFWDLYDKKVGNKKSCAKKWDKLSYELQSEILHHVQAYVQSTPDKKYRANPETYFNQERWTNEIIIQDERNKKSNGASVTELAETFGKHFADDWETYKRDKHI